MIPSFFYSGIIAPFILKPIFFNILERDKFETLKEYNK
jgi:hypothetical protein